MAAFVESVCDLSTMPTGDLAAVSRAAGVTRLYAEAPSLKSADCVFLDSFGSMLARDGVHEGENCSARSYVYPKATHVLAQTAQPVKSTSTPAKIEQLMARLRVAVDDFEQPDVA